jgi:hypothetical protein
MRVREAERHLGDDSAAWSPGSARTRRSHVCSTADRTRRDRRAEEEETHAPMTSYATPAVTGAIAPDLMVTDGGQPVPSTRPRTARSCGITLPAALWRRSSLA